MTTIIRIPFQMINGTVTSYFEIEDNFITLCGIHPYATTKSYCKDTSSCEIGVDEEYAKWIISHDETIKVGECEYTTRLELLYKSDKWLTRENDNTFISDLARYTVRLSNNICAVEEMKQSRRDL